MALSLLEVGLGVVISHSVLVGVRLGRLLAFITLGQADSQEGSEEDNLGMLLLASHYQDLTTVVLTFIIMIVQVAGDSRTLEQDCSPPELYTNQSVSDQSVLQTAGRLVWRCGGVAITDRKYLDQTM